MMKAKDAVVWINSKSHQVKIERWSTRSPKRWPDPGWWDVIGASYAAEWREMTNDQRVHLMLETVIDLAMRGYDIADVLRSFAQVEEFRALASVSYPMCRALTAALVGPVPGLEVWEEIEPIHFEAMLREHSKQSAE